MAGHRLGRATTRCLSHDDYSCCTRKRVVVALCIWAPMGAVRWLLDGAVWVLAGFSDQPRQLWCGRSVVRAVTARPHPLHPLRAASDLLPTCSHTTDQGRQGRRQHHDCRRWWRHWWRVSLFVLTRAHPPATSSSFPLLSSLPGSPTVSSRLRVRMWLLACTAI